MDEGTPIRLAVTVNRSTRSALFDFEGTVSFRGRGLFLLPLLLLVLLVGCCSEKYCCVFLQAVVVVVAVVAIEVFGGVVAVLPVAPACFTRVIAENEHNPP